MVSLYSAAQDRAHRRRFRLIEEFGQALAAGDQLRLVFQPRLALGSGECVGAEALLRWDHPELGAISPAEFVPLVEQTALIRPMTAWVIDAALAQLGRWQANGRALRLSVNVSAANLEEPSFAHDLRRELARRGLPPEWLEIEVTESAIISDVTAAAEQLTQLAEAGLSIAIDDFGTGHSSLAYLQTLPARTLKLDRCFTQSVLADPRQQRLIRAMIAMAHDLGYRVVAEGIETAEICVWLRAEACEEGQGHHLGPPMRAETFAEWLDLRPASPCRCGTPHPSGDAPASVEAAASR